MANLKDLSKAELIARLEQMEAQQAAPTPAPTAVTVDAAALMQAIVAAQHAQQHATGAKEERSYKAINAKSVTLGLQIPDPRTGEIRIHLLERKGDFVMLTKEQLTEMQARSPHLFRDGLLAVPDLLEANPNTILDFEAFIETLAFDDIGPRIEAITDLGTLWALFHHIESQRFITHDEKGNPLIEGRDRDAQFVVKEVRLDTKRAALELEVKRRIEALTPVKVNLDGK